MRKIALCHGLFLVVSPHTRGYLQAIGYQPHNSSQVAGFMLSPRGIWTWLPKLQLISARKMKPRRQEYYQKSGTWKGKCRRIDPEGIFSQLH